MAAPTAVDPIEYVTVGHPAYWRREAEVASSGVVARSQGLRQAALLEVAEDAEGITLFHQYVPQVECPRLFLARQLGLFATTRTPHVEWFVRDQFGSRIDHVERRGGWTALARTPLADLANELWRRRELVRTRFHQAPQLLAHGDATAANLRGRDGDLVIAIDWGTLGTAPVGSDVGLLTLSSKEEPELLLDAYREGLRAGGVHDPLSLGVVEFVARAVAVYTVFTRADWALQRVVAGEGALAGKYRHPSVAPYVRALQRQLPQAGALIDSW